LILCGDFELSIQIALESQAVNKPLAPEVYFAANLGVHMLNHGWTYADVARRSGLSASTIYNYVHGPGLPRASKRPALAAAIDVSVADLVAWTKGPVVDGADPSTDDPLEDTVREIRGVLMKMPPKHWPVVVDVLRPLTRLSVG
jgi:transcriptional regulator with XRE-family HTH domain